MWRLKISGDFEDYDLTDDEHDQYVHAIEEGAKYVELSGERFFSTDFKSLVRAENEIINDPLFIRYRRLGGSDEDVRMKMKIERYLNSRYPYERYVHDWNEINGVKDDVLLLENNTVRFITDENSD